MDIVYTLGDGEDGVIYIHTASSCMSNEMCMAFLLLRQNEEEENVCRILLECYKRDVLFC